MYACMAWTVAASGVLIAASSALAAGHRAEVRYAEIGMQEASRGGGLGSLLPPGSAVPRIGPNATQLDFARWAKNALSQGQNAEAELSLEWAQLRGRVDREEAALQAGEPPPADDDSCRLPVCQAMRAIGMGRTSEGMALIKATIASLQAPLGSSPAPALTADQVEARARQATGSALLAPQNPLASAGWWTWRRFDLIGAAWVLLNGLLVAFLWPRYRGGRGAAPAGRPGYKEISSRRAEAIDGRVKALRQAYVKPVATRSTSPRPIL